MKVWPVVFDSRPDYLGLSSGEPTLLGAPMGPTLLVSLVDAQIAAACGDAPTIVAPSAVPAAYRAALGAVVPRATVVASAGELAVVLQQAGPSDLLLFIDPRCLPADGWQLPALLAAHAEQPGMARHLVAHASDVGGTREHVSVDGAGLVRSVERYYRPVTWPFIAGVAATVVPVSSGLLPLTDIPTSLFELRELLAARGVPSRDVVMANGAFDLTDEAGMLAAVERSVLDAATPGGPTTMLVGRGHSIDPSARLLGPIIVQAGACIEARCTIVGPAIIGRGARVSAGAVLAHVSIGPDSVVPGGRVLRDRVWFASAASSIDAAATAPSGRRPPSFLQQMARHGIHVTEAAATPVAPEAQARFSPVVKRAIDVIVASTLLLLLAPLLALIAVVVWIDSRGPILFRDVREGLGGRQFNCLKFRTMRVGASELQRQLKEHGRLDGPHFKMQSDPRATRAGRWLRAANFDELPQLVNVLRGDMSLVGPRPSPFRENQICVPWREGRLSVRPGITGLWQVCRHDREAGDFHQWIEYDLLYVQNMSVALDLKVLTATLLTLGGKYPVPVSRLLPVDVPASPDVAATPPAVPGDMPRGDARASAIPHEATARQAR